MLDERSFADVLRDAPAPLREVLSDRSNVHIDRRPPGSVSHGCGNPDLHPEVLLRVKG